MIIYFTNVFLAWSSISTSFDSPNLSPENILVSESSILKVKNYNKWSKFDLSRLSTVSESDEFNNQYSLSLLLEYLTKHMDKEAS